MKKGFFKNIVKLIDGEKCAGIGNATKSSALSEQLLCRIILGMSYSFSQGSYYYSILQMMILKFEKMYYLNQKS